MYIIPYLPVKVTTQWAGKTDTQIPVQITYHFMMDEK